MMRCNENVEKNDLNGISEVTKKKKGFDDCLLNGGCEGKGSLDAILMFQAQKTE